MSITGALGSPSLGAHRLLGAGVGAALLLPDGQIDWWCPDRFDAAPLFWSLLDPGGGASRWCGAEPLTANDAPAGSTSRTSVLIGGEQVDLWDGLLPEAGGSILVRLARCRVGTATLTHNLRAGGFDRPAVPWHPGDHDVVALLGEDLDQRVAGDALVVTVRATAAQWRGFALTTSGAGPVRSDDLVRRLEDAEIDDQRAITRIRLPRQHPKRAVDALLVLRALTDPSTGAPVAAPTTSLPEAPGGDRQFDYRFSWLRDSGLAVATASQLGHLASARRYIEFVADLVDDDADLHPVTTTTGEPVPEERDVPGVEGWAGSRPVRVGNAAGDQRQLDAVASVLDAVYLYSGSGGRLDRRAWQVVDCLATKLAEAPFEPTSGIWEVRREQWLVGEELARWRGLDRAIRLRRRHRPWLRRPAWVAARRAARVRIEAVADPVTGRLPQTFEPGDTTPDAVALSVATSGFWPPHDARTRRLVWATIEALDDGGRPFLRRYPAADDGFTGTEGAFVPTSWWAVNALAVIGEVDAANRRADEMCAALPGLIPEEWHTGEGLGNTPLLWSHMEAARALYCLQEAEIRRRLGWFGAAAWRISRYLQLRLGSAPRSRPSAASTS